MTDKFGCEGVTGRIARDLSPIGLTNFELAQNPRAKRPVFGRQKCENVNLLVSIDESKLVALIVKVSQRGRRLRRTRLIRLFLFLYFLRFKFRSLTFPTA